MSSFQDQTKQIYSTICLLSNPSIQPVIYIYVQLSSRADWKDNPGRQVVSSSQNQTFVISLLTSGAARNDGEEFQVDKNLIE